MGDQVAQYLDATGSGHISLLEFMSGFAPKCTEEMRMDLLEQICITIKEHRHAIRLALRRFDVQGRGVVTRWQLKEVLHKLNKALDHGDGGPLTVEQIDELVASLGGEDETDA